MEEVINLTLLVEEEQDGPSQIFPSATSRESNIPNNNNNAVVLVIIITVIAAAD